MATTTKGEGIGHLFTKEAQEAFRRVKRKKEKATVANATEKVTAVSSSREGKTKRRGKRKHDERRDTDDTERLQRTIFVGNISVDVKSSALKKLFREHGAVESVRFRSVAVEGMKVEESGNQGAMRKACYIKGKINKDVSGTCNAYIVFKKVESVESALKLNGTVFEGFHLNVDRAIAKGESSGKDLRRSVFVGNIKFDATDEQLWKWFSERLPNGEKAVERVRIIRDRETRVGKGIGYVALKNPVAVLAALGLDGSDFEGRKLRIQRCKKSKRIKESRHDKALSPSISKRKRTGTSASKTRKPTFEGARVTLANQKNAMKRLARKQKKALKQQIKTVKSKKKKRKKT